jgi:hypothetical protein
MFMTKVFYERKGNEMTEITLTGFDTLDDDALYDIDGGGIIAAINNGWNDFTSGVSEEWNQLHW